MIAEHGRVDILFNNAGTVRSYEPIDSISLDDWNSVIDINLNGAFFGVRTVVPHMKRTGGGSIVNTSSIWGIAGAAGCRPTRRRRLRCGL